MSLEKNGCRGKERRKTGPGGRRKEKNSVVSARSKPFLQEHVARQQPGAGLRGSRAMPVPQPAGVDSGGERICAEAPPASPRSGEHGPGEHAHVADQPQRPRGGG